MLIDDFMDSTEEAESPRQYFFWSFLSTIAAVVNRNVYLNRGNIYNLYPNIYVLLVGKSGLRKGIPVSIAKKLVEETRLTRVVSGRLTLPALIKELGTAFSREGMTPLTDSVGYLVASEFASFLLDPREGLTILTDLYDSDYNKNWKNRLKHSGTDSLKNVNLTLLGAINPVHYKDYIPMNAIGGGFIARTFIVLANKPARRNSLVYAVEKKIDFPYFVEQLSEIGNLKGEMNWTPEAGFLYDEWYKQFSELNLEDDRTGTLDRFSDSVLKVAMLFALMDKRLEIQVEDVTRALECSSDLVANANKASIANAEPPKSVSSNIHKIVTIIYNMPDRSIDRRVLLRKLYHEQILAGELDLCMNTLREMGFVNADGTDDDINYSMPDEGARAYEKIFGGKK